MEVGDADDGWYMDRAVSSSMRAPKYTAPEAGCRIVTGTWLDWGRSGGESQIRSSSDVFPDITTVATLASALSHYAPI